jgi:hypothetical protein
VEQYDEGLRCQDVHTGLRNIDPNSGAVVPLKTTRLVGMAADVAALIRGRELIPDLQALETVAVTHHDVNPMAFNTVLEVLEEAGFVELVRDAHGEPSGLTENVPFYHELYTDLGGAWRSRHPRQLEEELLAVVNRLAGGPVPLESLAAETGVDTNDVDELTILGRQSGLVRTVSTIDGDIAYSPFSAFEDPAKLDGLLTQFGPDQMLDEFDKLKNHQGIAITAAEYPMLVSAVAQGVLPASKVKLPDGTEQAFATLPYMLDREILVGRKPVLEKVRAIIACVRCGEHFGGYTDVRSAVAIINKLLDPDRGYLNPHSSHERQYAIMRNMGILRFAQSGVSYGPRPTLIDTPDNREALAIARDLIANGEPWAGRDPSPEAQDLLSLGTTYQGPMQTMKWTMERNRAMVQPTEHEMARVFEAMMGRKSL